jgi:hypothetical protein
LAPGRELPVLAIQGGFMKALFFALVFFSSALTLASEQIVIPAFTFQLTVEDSEIESSLSAASGGFDLVFFDETNRKNAKGSVVTVEKRVHIPAQYDSSTNSFQSQRTLIQLSDCAQPSCVLRTAGVEANFELRVLKVDGIHFSSGGTPYTGAMSTAELVEFIEKKPAQLSEVQLRTRVRVEGVLIQRYKPDPNHDDQPTFLLKTKEGVEVLVDVGGRGVQQKLLEQYYKTKSKIRIFGDMQIYSDNKVADVPLIYPHKIEIQ